jgi:hypothetical protein
MSRTTRILTLLVATLPLATVARASQLGDYESPARFQLTVSEGVLYVMDTATGECWSKSVRGKSWTNHGSPVPDREEPKEEKPLSLELPNDVVTITIRQRRSRPIPGSDNRIRINLDDITGGQVIMSISDDRGEVLLEEASLKPGEVVTFEVNDKAYFARVKELTNVLIGTDIAVIEVAADRDAFPAHVPKPKSAEEGGDEVEKEEDDE